MGAVQWLQNEIQEPRKRYSLIDHAHLAALLDTKGIDGLINSYSVWVDEALEKKGKDRDIRWTGNIAACPVYPVASGNGTGVKSGCSI